MSAGWINPMYEPGLVSVIVPCYNQEKFLQECLQSLIGQSYRPVELILIDDGSSDGTREIMRECMGVQNSGLSVKCIYQSNRGAPNARNQGCRVSKGEFLQFLDGDDVLAEDKLIEQVKFLQGNKAIDAVYGDGQYLVHMGEKITRKGRIISIGPSVDIVASLLSGSWVPPFSYLIRRTCIDNCGPWDERLSSLQDYEYFLRMALKGAVFCYKEGITGFYRKHSLNSISERDKHGSELIRQRILGEAWSVLRMKGELNEKRVIAMVEGHRRVARHIYLYDKPGFRRSIEEIRRLAPSYVPKKKIARIISNICGLEKYEKLAAIMFFIINAKKRGWF